MFRIKRIDKYVIIRGAGGLEISSSGCEGRNVDQPTLCATGARIGCTGHYGYQTPPLVKDYEATGLRKLQASIVKDISYGATGQQVGVIRALAPAWCRFERLWRE